MTAPDLSEYEAAVVAHFDASAPAPESFDATAALQRVLSLANDYDDGSEWGAALYRGDVIRNQIRAAIAGDAL